MDGSMLGLLLRLVLVLCGVLRTAGGVVNETASDDGAATASYDSAGSVNTSYHDAGSERARDAGAANEIASAHGVGNEIARDDGVGNANTSYDGAGNETMSSAVAGDPLNAYRNVSYCLLSESVLETGRDPWRLRDRAGVPDGCLALGGQVQVDRRDVCARTPFRERQQRLPAPRLGPGSPEMRGGTAEAAGVVGWSLR
ncbi:hypothetical protein DFH09DRAFT_1094721 [Mycena vulgaris]|nr:hypothetical protein DFH09DRAFT_1094721 [Mycena vulgaris]